MLLCRLCHWPVDEGRSGVSGRLVTLADRILLGPVDRPLWPNREALGWHRRKVFLNR